LPDLYKTVGERRYRETSGLYGEDFAPSDVFEHRPGRTVLDVDNAWLTVSIMNTQPVPQFHLALRPVVAGRMGNEVIEETANARGAVDLSNTGRRPCRVAIAPK
jgi:hypothetical protein